MFSIVVAVLSAVMIPAVSLAPRLTIRKPLQKGPRMNFNLPSWGASNAPAPGAPTPATTTQAVQFVALAMIALSFVGALVVMVADYIAHGDVALPSVVSAILFFGLGFVTHALGNAQGATTAQSSAQTGAAIQQSGQTAGATTTATATSAANVAAGAGAGGGGSAV